MSPFCRCNETKSYSATRAFCDDRTSTSCIENYCDHLEGLSYLLKNKDFKDLF